ncbi:MAG: DUF4837 family protein [Ignavibacteriales bacterium]
MKKTLILLACFFLAVLLTSCSKKKSLSTGPEDRIYVVADSMEFKTLYSALDSVFGKIIYTPQPEKMFELTRVDMGQLDKLKDSKNIIILASLNSDSEVSKYISTLLDPSLKNKVNSGSEFVFNKYNHWAENQLVMVLTSRDTERLREQILDKSAELLYYFQKMSNRRLLKSLYMDKYENKEIEAKFLKDYGWVIYVQKDYQLVLDKPADNFVWLRNLSNDMARWIFVHWIDNATPEFLNPDSIAKERNRLTEKYLKPAGGKNYVRITDRFKTTGEVNFKGHYSLETQGLWEMNDRSMGGPFINYTFFDEKTKRIYMLDGSLYAPKYVKKGLIQQLDVLLQSFMTEQQLPPEKKKDIMASAKQSR